MKKTKFYLLIIASLVIIMILMRSCSSNKPCPEPIKETKIDTVWVEKIVKDTFYTPKETVYIPGSTTYKDIDTLAILQDFFAKRVYDDTIRITGVEGFLVVKDTISQNRIISRNISGKYEFPVITKEETIIAPPRNQVYWGFDILGNKKEPINYFGGALMFKNKKDHVYDFGLGYDVNNGLTGKFGMKWKIRLKK